LPFFHIISQFSSVFSKYFHYSTYFSFIIMSPKQSLGDILCLLRFLLFLLLLLLFFLSSAKSLSDTFLGDY
jgi:hypothetical protein